MRKNLLLILLLSLSFSAFSQYKIGFQFSPILSSNRIDFTSDDYDLETDGTGLKISTGPFVDIQLTDNYYVNVGVFYASKRVGIEARDKVNTGTPPTKEEYDLQYVQIPVSMKLYTNEVSLDKRIYFQFGAALEFNVEEKLKDNVIVEDFRLFDTSLLAGLGMEYQIGTSTMVFGGISYHRGLVNIISESVDGLGGDLAMKNDYIALDLGIKF
uniref:porin family protein n=1 Tax=Fulvivirga sp. TaxID=1931237 RepID=UPI00404AD1F1